MPSNLLGLIEMLGVFALVAGWAVHELVTLQKDRRARERAARPPDAGDRPD